MQLFDRKFSLFMLFFCLPLLFLPKINLVRFEGETAGIRIDDVFLFGASLMLFWAHFSLNKSMTEIERWLGILTCFALFSFGVNRIFFGMGWIHVTSKIFYAVRLFEYFLFFYIGAIAFRFFSLSQIMKAFFGWNVLWMILQKFSLVGGIGSSGYAEDMSGRLQGIASFPSEMGVLLNILFCFLIYEEGPSGKWLQLLPSPIRCFIQTTYLYWLFVFFAVLVIFTGNRISILALLFCFFFKWKNDMKEKLSKAAMMGGIVFIGMIFFLMAIVIYNTSAVFERSMELFSWKNLDLIVKVWDHIDITYDPIGRESVRMENYDASWWMRIHKWCYALKIYFSHPEAYLQGVGPGFAMAALDGGFIRILTEYGIIGCYIFWKFFSYIYKLNIQLKWMLIACFINMLFFEVFQAYKPMSLIFFAVGFYYAQAFANEEEAFYLDRSLDQRALQVTPP